MPTFTIKCFAKATPNNIPLRGHIICVSGLTLSEKKNYNSFSYSKNIAKFKAFRYGHFIKHKHLISEECMYENYECTLCTFVLILKTYRKYIRTRFSFKSFMATD